MKKTILSNNNEKNSEIVQEKRRSIAATLKQ